MVRTIEELSILSFYHSLTSQRYHVEYYLRHLDSCEGYRRENQTHEVERCWKHGHGENYHGSRVGDSSVQTDIGVMCSDRVNRFRFLDAVV